MSAIEGIKFGKFDRPSNDANLRAIIQAIEEAAAAGAGGAPASAEYLVGAANAGLSAERVVTDTATVEWDLATAAQAKANVPDDAVTDAKLRNSGALSVVGRSANSTGDPADIAATPASGAVLRESGSTLGFGTVATAGIADAAVTYAKIQDVSATSRVLGRKSSGAGDVEELTLSETLDFIGSAAQGDILYRGASGWARLGAGTSGFFLKTLGASANPLWASPGGLSGRYDPDRTPSSGLDANSSDEFIGSINTGLQTWGNQGGASSTWEIDTLRLAVPAGVGQNRRCLWYTPPSGTNWVMSARVNGGAFSIWPAPAGAGLIVLETGTIATPTSLSAGLFQRSSSTNMSWGFYSATSYTSAYTIIGAANTISTLMVVGPSTWLQLRYVTSTKALSYWISFDGFNFAQTGTTRTLGAHPVNIGIFADDNNANSAVDFRFNYLRTRTDATGTSSPYPVGE